MTGKELKRLAGLLAPLQMPRMSHAEPPPRDNGFGSPLRAVARALGSAGDGRGSDLPNVDRRQPPATGLVSRPARGQAGEASGEVDPPSEAELTFRQQPAGSGGVDLS
jgi:hypothetical protein